MRLENVTAIFRALPKGQRKLLVPVPDHAKAALEDLARDENRLGRLPGFHEWLAQWVTQQIGASVSAGDLAALELPEHLRMNLRVLDAEDRVIAEGRDLLAIKRRVYGVTVASGVGSGGGLSGGAGSHGGAGRGSAAGLRGEVGSGGGLPGSAGSRGGVGRGGAAGLGGEVGSGGGLSGGAGSRGVVGRGSAAGPRGEVSGGGLPGSAGGGAGYGGRVGSTGGGAGAGASEPLHKQWDFGELPETRQVERNRLKLVVYPALEDRVSGVAVVEARNAHAAQEMSRAGMVRLAMLVLPQQAKFVSKRMADDRDLVLLSRGLSLRQSLAEALTQRAFRECFFPADVPLPRDAQSFSRRLDESRARLSDLADRLAVTVTSIFREWRAARAALDNLSHPAFADAASDIEAQLRVLLPPDFLESTPQPWLDSLPRYLKAINRRLERLRSNQRRDSELTAKVKPFSAALRGLMAEPVLYGSRAEIDQLRWMIEEFRVSLFAQELKTLLRVSEKRLAEQLDLAQQSRP
jgi:ATP-dependent helicase HrpA